MGGTGIPNSPETLWKLNPFWLTPFPDPDPIPEWLTSFFCTNLDSADIGVVWDSVKAFLRGQFIYLINNIKTSTKASETFILTEAGKE